MATLKVTILLPDFTEFTSSDVRREVERFTAKDFLGYLKAGDYYVADGAKVGVEYITPSQASNEICGWRAPRFYELAPDGEEVIES